MVVRTLLKNNDAYFFCCSTHCTTKSFPNSSTSLCLIYMCQILLRQRLQFNPSSCFYSCPDLYHFSVATLLLLLLRIVSPTYNMTCHWPYSLTLDSHENTFNRCSLVHASLLFLRAPHNIFLPISLLALNCFLSNSLVRYQVCELYGRTGRILRLYTFLYMKSIIIIIVIIVLNDC